jgi:hypothetical protein
MAPLERQILPEHLNWVADCILQGEVTPFLGAGVNLCDRPQDVEWDPKRGDYLPTAVELAHYLARELRVPDGSGDLPRIAQAGVGLRDTKDLYAKLRAVLESKHPATSAHRFLASLPTPPQLIVSTNYDDLMERAFQAAGVRFDLLVYEAEGLNKGRFWHHPASGEEAILIKRPNAYPYPFLVDAPVVLKIHGSIDSYIITEDHYIDYLANRPLEQIIPAILLDRIRNSRLLFLGYSLRDWNLRVFLRRLTQSQRLGTKHWAISLYADEAEIQFWRSTADVEILQVPLDAYVRELAATLQSRLQPSAVP